MHAEVPVGLYVRHLLKLSGINKYQSQLMFFPVIFPISDLISELVTCVQREESQTERF
jgi:hypothetical protein